MTVDEEITLVQSDITKVNVSLTKLASGESVSRLQIGSGDSQRQYEFKTPSMDDLLRLKAFLQNRLNTLLAQKTGQDIAPSFRANSFIPLKVIKRD